MNKEQQKHLITEIMNEDAKDGLYDTVNDTVKYTEEDMRAAFMAGKRFGMDANPDNYRTMNWDAFIKKYNEILDKEETLYTEEQVNQKMIDFAEWCRIQYKINGETFLIEQLFSEYKSLKQSK